MCVLHSLIIVLIADLYFTSVISISVVLMPKYNLIRYVGLQCSLLHGHWHSFHVFGEKQQHMWRDSIIWLSAGGNGNDQWDWEGNGNRKILPLIYTPWTEKTHHNILSYLPQNPVAVGSDEIWYALSWINLRYSSLNIFHLTWIMSLHYLVKLSICVLLVNSNWNCESKNTSNVFVMSSTKQGRFW